MSETQAQTPTDTVQDDRAVFEFLFPKTKTKHDRIKLICKLREFINELPETKGTFAFHVNRFDDWTPYGPLTKGERTAMKDIPFWFLGIWQLKQPYKATGGSNKRRYVNPDYPHTLKHSDCLVQCKCGTYISTVQKNTNNVVDVGVSHEACRADWRHESFAELYRKRRKQLISGLQYGLEGRLIGDRLGIASSTLTHCANALDVSIDKHRKIGQQKRAYSVDKLLECGYEPQTIATVFDVGWRACRRSLKDYGLYYGRHDQ